MSAHNNSYQRYNSYPPMNRARWIAVNAFRQLSGVFERDFDVQSVDSVPINLERRSKEPPARSWIEATFHKRECCKYIPHPKDELRCSCGRSTSDHAALTFDSTVSANDIWLPSKHTKSEPTDAYGTIEFQGGPHPCKAQYVRVSYDTRPDLLIQLFTREWNLELPKLLISVQGGKANFELQPKLKKVLRKGLLKAAKTTGAWIFTSGTNTGVTRQVGDALLSERTQRSGRVVSLGIAPWGIVENNQELVGLDRDVPYHSISSPRSKFAALNNRLTYFLLVDNGTHGKYGAEIVLRRKLEKFISNQRLQPYTHSSIPVVCLVIEGGTNTIRAVLEYVTDDPPVPVVVCDGSGRAADLIAFVHKYASNTDNGDQPVLEAMKDYLLSTIQRTFEVGIEQAECLYTELLQCTQKKNLITIFRISERADPITQELDQTILTALFRSQHLSPSEQLSLALTWNRVDIARSEIFVYGQEWPSGALNEAMMQALEHDRTDFVKLLLENGVSMRKFLTIPRLEELYNSKQGPSNTLGYILRDVRPHIPRGYVYTLHDIGLVINKLMGGAYSSFYFIYRAYYTRRKFRPIYAKVMNKTPLFRRNSIAKLAMGNTMSLLAEALPTQGYVLFDYPFNELLIWAVLMKRQKMALLMWQHGEEALAKALIACKLYKAMAHEAAEDDMETEVYEELRAYGKEFENIALELLDYCYRQDDDVAQQLLTCELQNWSGQTCLSLAVAANHRALLAHPCSQIILADLWMGGLRTRKNTNLKIVLGLLFPPYILQLEFKSKEELQLMPQTAEEHLELVCDIDDDLSESEKSLDAEKRTRNMSIRNKSNPQQGVKALLTDSGFMPRDTVVQENGKVLPESDETKYLFYHHWEDSFFERRTRPLKAKKKLYEFFTAPITKFWANSIAYLVFLVIFSYTVLVKMEKYPTWQECLAISYIVTLGCEKVRELLSSEPETFSHKFAVWVWNMWNPCDAAAILFFMVALVLRLQDDTMSIGRVMYCVNSVYWYLRILNILGVNKYLGPLVTMMGKMVKNMIYFVVLLLVVLMSFGVCRQAILHPNQEPDWKIARDVFFEPYFMLYGEVFADSIDPPCGQEDQEECLTGHWITPAVMSIYLLIANILLINLLIAVFNNIFIEVNAVSHQVWMFQRFTVVMEYEQKPILPPPFILLCHIYLVCKYIKRKCKGIRETYDNGLKLFLEKEDMERLYDFEEECVEGYFAEQDYKLQQSTEDRIRVTTERVENIVQKVEDINTKENCQTQTMQNLEFRLRKVEEASQDILEHLAVIHRFMATQTLEELPPIPVPGPDRIRKMSERSDAPSEDSHLSIQPPPVIRRKPTRSLTEVRPDAYIFDDGLHFEVRIIEEDIEQEECLDNISISGSRKHLDIIEERQMSRESKSSLNSEKLEEVDKLSVEDMTALSLDTLRARSAARRRDSCGRRSSDGGANAEESLHGSKRSLTRRQISQTQSEPDNSDHTVFLPVRAGTVERSVTFAEPRIKVIPPTNSGPSAPPANPRAKLLCMHTEYTSITDEIESVCGLLSPPRTPRLLSPPRPGQSNSAQNQRRRCVSEMSNPEMALYIEKEHLRDAEESDYMLMENLIQRRYEEELETEEKEKIEAIRNKSPAFLSVVQESKEYRNAMGRILRRASAIEDDVPTPTIECSLDYSFNDASTSNDTDCTHLTAIQIGTNTENIQQSRQESTESTLTSDMVPLVDKQMPQRPSIVIDSSQLPIQFEQQLQKAESNSSLHMQSETMC
ncbi:transient receptor potential cation channel trpm isoform X4 [Onthophagus taurus]|uniref:transient receptor potential cation channel trpm isoform X4 n=1 Tax=Onthophagus taurus TaxID=166361 RepID=UPI0039BDB77E